MFVKECRKCNTKYPVDTELCPYCGYDISVTKEVFVEEPEKFSDTLPSGRNHEEEPKWDAVDNVKHYQVFPEKDIEAKDIIGRLANLCGIKGDKLYWYLTALKYMLRMGRKGSPEEDAKKARKYLDWFIGD